MIAYGRSRYIASADELRRASIETWNAAIEAAALIVQPVPHVDEERACQDIAAKIRELKRA